MNPGQKVICRPSSRVAREWQIPREAFGTLICRYRILRENSAKPDRMDVRFDGRLIVWGAPAIEFEAIDEVR